MEKEEIDHAQIPVFEYNYIDDGIYIGNNQCCQMHFDEKLGKKEGVTADMSLEETKVDQPFGVDFYTWIPVADRSAPTQDKLDFAVTALEKFVAMKRKVYVHCKNGHGRAPTVVAAYFIKKGMGVDEAIDFITKHRPTVHIEDVQKEALVEFEKRVRL